MSFVSKLCLGFILACSSAMASAQSVDGTVKLVGGEVQGLPRDSAGVKVFEGIPYAAPPLGELRWKAPVPAVWQGLLKAVVMPPDCPQPQRVYTAERGIQGPQSEDCLYANVWTPAKTAEQRLPVMVWIYGGGFREGSASNPLYNGEALARKGVVYVNFNYRLGALGFLAHPALTAETPQKSSGNYGIMDMVFALKWVHDNIAAFGGDASRVTIFGQSAGSMSVSMLTASPLTHGLIQRVIGQSGAAFGATSFMTLKPLSNGEKIGVEFMKRFHVDTLEQMRAIPASELIKAQTGAPIGFMDPVIDNYVVPQDTLQAFSLGKQNDVPTLIGATTHEGGTTFSGGDFKAAITRSFTPDGADLLLKLFPSDTDKEREVVARNYSDLISPWMMRDWAKLQSSTGQQPVFLYSFDQAPPWTPSRGAYHSSDLYYTFGTFGVNPLPWTDKDRKLGEMMASYWTNFAANGDPNGPGLPAWPRYTSVTDRLMVLSGDAVVARPVAEARALDVIGRAMAMRRDGSNTDSPGQQK